MTIIVNKTSHTFTVNLCGARSVTLHPFGSVSADGLVRLDRSSITSEDAELASLLELVRAGWLATHELLEQPEGGAGALDGHSGVVARSKRAGAKRE